MNESKDEKAGFAGKLAAYFINSRLTLLIVIFSMLLGLMAISLLPREEEPQIKVPMIDVMVSMPGATPAEIEQQVTIPMEKLLYELPGKAGFFNLWCAHCADLSVVTLRGWPSCSLSLASFTT